jgi:protease secretion system outer membrane protein
LYKTKVSIADKPAKNLQLNQSKIDALEQQSQAAEQKYKLGQGTVTDLRDVQVKTKQARAQQFTLQSQQQVAAQQYAALVGERPELSAFALPLGRPALPASSLQELLDQALQASPAILSARALEHIAELDVKKARGSLLPTVSASYSNSKSGSVSNNYTGITMNVPLQAGSWLGVEAAQANALKAQEIRKEAESKTRLEAERLYSLIQAGSESLQIQREAIAAAELSVQANRQSYQGGVRSAVDVINAIQTVFQVKSDYATMAELLERIGNDVVASTWGGNGADTYTACAAHAAEGSAERHDDADQADQTVRHCAPDDACGRVRLPLLHPFRQSRRA